MPAPPTRGARLGHGLGALAFVACAVVQLNDPDPARWVALYSAAAALCAATAAGRPAPWPAPGALTALAAAWAVAVGVAFAGSAEGWTDELAREVGGLALVAAWMAALAAQERRRRLRGGADRAK